MPRKTPLRAVTEDDAPPIEPKSLKEAATVSERALLVAMRGKALGEIDNGVPPAYLAPLMRQVREMDKELRALDLRAKQEGEERGSVDDETWDDEAL